MKSISREIIITSLFELGFESVDPILYSLTFEEISKLDKNGNFRYINMHEGIGFYNFVDSSGGICRLKKGYKLDTEIYISDSAPKEKVRDMLVRSESIVDLLKYIDFKKIIEQKMKIYKVSSIKNMDPELFCSKEIEIISGKKSSENTPNKILYKGLPRGYKFNP